MDGSIMRCMTSFEESLAAAQQWRRQAEIAQEAAASERALALAEARRAALEVLPEVKRALAELDRIPPASARELSLNGTYSWHVSADQVPMASSRPQWMRKSPPRLETAGWIITYRPISRGAALRYRSAQHLFALEDVKGERRFSTEQLAAEGELTWDFVGESYTRGEQKAGSIAVAEFFAGKHPPPAAAPRLPGLIDVIARIVVEMTG
jgi:hypothetical protein